MNKSNIKMRNNKNTTKKKSRKCMLKVVVKLIKESKTKKKMDRKIL